MRRKLETLLLVALPASGKSEVRKFLREIDAQGRGIPGLGKSVQLDDYPFVSYMRAVDLALDKLGHPPIFFRGPNGRFINPRNWGALIHIINMMYSALRQRMGLPVWEDTTSAGRWLMEQIELGQRRAGMASAFRNTPSDVLDCVANLTYDHSTGLLNGMTAKSTTDDLRAKFERGVKTDETVVIEFARGGPIGATMPLEPPMGYYYAFSQLSCQIFDDLDGILYVAVDPEESRRKNLARFTPAPGEKFDEDIHHGVPMEVMIWDYGCDDIQFMIPDPSIPEGRMGIWAHGESYILPQAIFDNTDDITTFARLDPGEWCEEDVERLTERLQGCISILAER